MFKLQGRAYAHSMTMRFKRSTFPLVHGLWAVMNFWAMPGSLNAVVNADECR